MFKEAACLAAPPVLYRSADLSDPQHAQYDEYDGDHDQRMNPTASLRETWADIPTEKAKHPENHQDYNERPQHEISSFK